VRAILPSVYPFIQLIHFSFGIQRILTRSQRPLDRRKKPRFRLDQRSWSVRRSAMPQEVGVEYPGAVYHVTSRGDQREDIFLEDVGRRRFAPRPRVPIQFRIR
jgi:hypothetical protein